MITIHFDDFTEVTVKSIEEATSTIEEANSDSIGVDRIYEVNEAGEETGKEYGCNWKLVLEEIS